MAEYVLPVKLTAPMTVPPQASICPRRFASVPPCPMRAAYFAIRSGRAKTYIAFGAPGTRPPPTGMARYCRPSTA